MRLKTTKTLIMLVAFATLLSVGVFILIGCEETEASKSDQGQETTLVKACPSEHVKSCCEAKKEAKTCPEKKEGNPNPGEQSKSCCEAKKEAKTCPAEKESNLCSGDK